MMREGKIVKLAELLKEIEVKETNVDLSMEVGEVCYDSRAVKKGDVFVAICGYETDGHRFIGKAVEQGAGAIICQKKPQDGIPYILTENTRYALAIMGKNRFGAPADHMKMIGVTGTNGKTTTTYLIKKILESKGAKVGLIGTNQNMIGEEVLPTERTTPESYELHKLFAQMRDAGCTHVVMEVSSHSLILDRVAGIHFSVGVFTNLTQDHLDFHKTMDAYRDAKAILFTMCDVGVINYDDEAGRIIKDHAKCRTITFSARNDAADLVAKTVKLKAEGVEFAVVTEGEIARVSLGIPGEFSVYNALSAIGCALALDIHLEDSAEALKVARGVKGRAEVVSTDTDYTVLIDYAHSPDGIDNILKTVRGFTKGKVIALFGCGGDRDKTKRPKMGRISANLADYCIVTSDNPRTEKPEAIIEDILEGMKDSKCPYKVIVNRPEAIHYALDFAQEGDTIVLMGKGHETYQEINHVKHHLDEREVIADYFAQKRKS